MSAQRALLVVAATIGGILLAIVIGTFWLAPNDNLAYWIAGQRLVAGEPIYASAAEAFEPYAYHYLPPLAQVLAPLTIAVPPVVYLAAFRALLLVSTWQLAGRRAISMLALIAFLPVALDLRFENVNILTALAIVLGLGRWPWLFAVAAIVKVSPGLGVVYLTLQRRWRDAIVSAAVGLVIAGISFALDPGLWQQWYGSVVERAGMAGNSLIPVPYVLRAVLGFGLAVAGGLVGRRSGELLLVGAITIANPNLALNGLAVLAAAVPIWRAGPDGIAASVARR